MQEIVMYRATMSLAKSMLEKGYITNRDYCKIDRIIAEKYGLDLCDICFRNPLIYPDSRVNMTPNK